MPDGRLYRVSREGKAKTAGFLDDYAFLAWALTDLHEATNDNRWRTAAGELLAQITSLFGRQNGNAEGDVVGGLFFTDKLATDLFVRQRSATDSPLPSGNAAAALALIARGEAGPAAHLVAAFARNIQGQGEGMSSLVQAAMRLVATGATIKTQIIPDAASEPPSLQSPAAEAAGAVSASVRRDGARQLVVPSRSVRVGI